MVESRAKNSIFDLPVGRFVVEVQTGALSRATEIHLGDSDLHWMQEKLFGVLTIVLELPFQMFFLKDSCSLMLLR